MNYDQITKTIFALRYAAELLESLVPQIAAIIELSDDDIPIAELGLGPRASKIMEAMGVLTVNSLIEKSKQVPLLAWPNMGKTTFREVHSALDKFNKSWRLSDGFPDNDKGVPKWFRDGCDKLRTKQKH